MRRVWCAALPAKGLSDLVKSEMDVDDLAAHLEGGIYGEDENGFNEPLT